MQRKKRSLILLIFISSVLTGILGDQLPFSPFLPVAFPAFVNLGVELEEMGNISAFWATPPAKTLSLVIDKENDFAVPAISPTPTMTPSPTVSPTKVPTYTPTPLPTNESTQTPTLTPEPATPTTRPPSPTPTIVVCTGAMPSRVSPNKTALVVNNLNMRSSPEITANNWLRTNVTGTVLEIIGNPVCNADPEIPYLWWPVRAPDNLTGWSVEASAKGDFYFLEPIK